MEKKGDVDYLPWILASLALLAILMITIFLLKDTGISLIDKLKSIFKGR